MNDNLVIQGTPWEEYEADSITIYVKREDLCCPYPGPSFSKIRGVAAYLGKLDDNTSVGVLDTVHSKAGWGVSYICNKLSLPCINFYPVYKAEGSLSTHKLRPNQREAKSLGATMAPLQAGRSAILYYQSRKILRERTNGAGVMLPNALKLQETVDATAQEVTDYTPDKLFRGTWVISISSGTIAAGVVKGLKRGHENIDIISHMGYSRSIQHARGYICMQAGYEPDNLWLIDEGYAYKDAVDYPCSFPCNKYYDLKAWEWLMNNLEDLEQPIVFWNIGD